MQNIQDSHPFNIFAWLTLGSGADLRNEFKIPAAITGEFESHSIASSPTYVDDVARKSTLPGNNAAKAIKHADRIRDNLCHQVKKIGIGLSLVVILFYAYLFVI